MLSLCGRDSANSEMLHDATDYRPTEDSRFRGAFYCALLSRTHSLREHDDCSGSSVRVFGLTRNARIGPIFDQQIPLAGSRSEARLWIVKRDLMAAA